jgi:hypothetical protein
MLASRFSSAGGYDGGYDGGSSTFAADTGSSGGGGFAAD